MPHAEGTDQAPDEPAITRLPPGVRAVLRRLAAAGYPSLLVGGCVRDLWQRRPVRDFDVATPAPPETVLATLPRAIPIGLHHGTVMVPTADGPVDVTTFRHGPRLEDDLAHRDFRVNALACDPTTGRILDPHGGRADLRAGRLRAVGAAAERLGEDPLRALRALRLLSERGLEPDRELRAALRGAGPELGRVAGERIRSELERVLLGPHVGRALRLARETGLESALLPGVPAEAARRVAALRPEADLRWLGWLVGTQPGPLLARLRFSGPRRDRLRRLLADHPVHHGASPMRPDRVRRLLQRHGARDLMALLELAERAGRAGGAPATDARDAVATLRRAVAQAGASTLALHRPDLAIDGQAVMGVLGCGPGPVVGEALRYLLECVLDDPTLNRPEALRAHLRAWAQEHQ